MKEILIVDDDPEVVHVLRFALQKAGYPVSGAANGVEAVKLARQKDFAALICDILMPKKGGFETISEVRRHRPNIKVIAISGGGVVSGDLYLRAVEHLGADRTLLKPFPPGPLVAMVRDLIGDPSRKAASAAD